MTNNQTPTESMFNEETSSELVDQPKKDRRKSNRFISYGNQLAF